jgi:hypothetical protein
MKKVKFHLLCVCLIIASNALAHEYHVAKNGSDNDNGSKKKPFKTINGAVKYAVAGDTITVHAGIYREWVNPLRGGESNEKRIVYRAATGEKVEIKGSEIVSGWKKQKNGIWKITLANSFFADYNPYKDPIAGDWFNNKGRLHHTGEVFLNGKSLYEKETLDKVIEPVINETISDPKGSNYTWYCESNEQETTIYANFQKADPNKELVEITTRRTVFFPEKPGINYITIKGFIISQAATQWAAPTAEQVGMIATHWNKGWIIEDNIISDSKCTGITLGKDKSTGHNVWSKDEGSVNRDGNIHYIEVTFNVLRNNWTKDNIGSHIVRNNQIFNCEQAGICGSMGAAFSIIENNHIYNIWQKRQFEGWEIGGIKFHAPIDVMIRNNTIHDCGLGVWLDWMTQGTRVSGNLCYRNEREDFYVEVNHGPYVVDNNIFLSKTAISNQSEGGAYVHNLIAGAVNIRNDLNRFTPYFLPHSTNIAGLTTIFGGDDRFYNNIFVGGTNAEAKYGLEGYQNSKLPIWIKGNLYFGQAKPSDKDENFKVADNNPFIKLVENKGEKFLEFSFDSTYDDHKVEMISTEMLGKAKISKAKFENPDGSAIQFNTDYFGKKRETSDLRAGPFSEIKMGKSIIKVR